MSVKVIPFLCGVVAADGRFSHNTQCSIARFFDRSYDAFVSIRNSCVIRANANGQPVECRAPGCPRKHGNFCCFFIDCIPQRFVFQRCMGSVQVRVGRNVYSVCTFTEKWKSAGKVYISFTDFMSWLLYNRGFCQSSTHFCAVFFALYNKLVKRSIRVVKVHPCWMCPRESLLYRL